MNRFGGEDFFNEDDNNYDHDYDDDYVDESEHGLMGATIPADLMNQWKQAEVDLENQKINFVILKQVIGMLNKSWWYRWQPLQTRMKMLSDTYSAVSDMVNSDI